MSDSVQIVFDTYLLPVNIGSLRAHLSSFLGDNLSNCSNSSFYRFATTRLSELFLWAQSGEQGIPGIHRMSSGNRDLASNSWSIPCRHVS